MVHNERMQSNSDLHVSKEVADAYRLAFNDLEFLNRPETRGIRFQLELLKPELVQSEAGIQNTIVVFGSARFKEDNSYYQAARKFARLVSEGCKSLPKLDRLTICTGGGPGIMEAANRGAMDAGAPSVALNISLPREQKPNPYVTPELCFQFHYFALRKMHFAMRAKALIAFPGGFGTLDELFEILTLVQTRKVKTTPVLLYGSDYWKRLIDFEWMVTSGTISQEDLACFKYVDSPEEAWADMRTLLPS
jgi:uncharacterized protein (TIGR00730 family)